MICNIDNFIETLDYEQIDFNDLCEYVCSILNDKQILVEIYKSTKLHHFIKDFFFANLNIKSLLRMEYFILKLKINIVRFELLRIKL